MAVTVPRSLKLPAPGKLNAFLHVTGRRADGYHTLESLFVPIARGDIVALEARDDGVIARVRGATGIAAEDDLAVRAARLLQRHCNQKRPESQLSSGRGRPVRTPCREADRGQQAETEQQSEKFQTAHITCFGGLHAGPDTFVSFPCKSPFSSHFPRTIAAVQKRVVIIEDHPLMLSALRETMEQADGFAVVGTAAPAPVSSPSSS